jgi:NADH-quinone oxidoreductase subunit L
MGGLRKKMPHTCYTFYIGGAALSGLVFTSGFFSKDEILAKAFEYHPALWGVGIITAGMTAFYTFRAIFLAFEGEPRDQHLYDHAHENNPAITIPLWILAGLATVGGLLGLPAPVLHGLGIEVPHLLDEWLHPIFIEVGHGEHAAHLPLSTELALMGTSAVVGILSIGLAYYLYVLNPSIPRSMARSTRPIFNLLANKYYIDEIYGFIFVKPLTNLAGIMAHGIDTLVIDKGLVDGTAQTVGVFGKLVSSLQNGYISRYALATFVGVLLLVGYFLVGEQFVVWLR